MRKLLLLLVAGCGPTTGTLTMNLPIQATSAADRIRLSVFEEQTCAALSFPLDGRVEPAAHDEFSRGALSDTTGQSATLSLENVPAEVELTLTAEVFGRSGELQFQGCEEGIMISTDEHHSIVLSLR